MEDAIAERGEERFLLFSRGAAIVATSFAMLVVASLLLATVRSAPSEPAVPSLGEAALWARSLVATSLALAVAFPIALFAAFFVTECAAPSIARLLRGGLEVYVALPSVLFGLWGRDALVPWLLRTFPAANVHPTVPMAVLLATMMLPHVALACVRAFERVPWRARESAIALGAMRWELALGVVLPLARTSIFRGLVRVSGRALGEAVALRIALETFDTISSPGLAAALLSPRSSGNGPAALLLFATVLAVQALAGRRLFTPSGADVGPRGLP